MKKLIANITAIFSVSFFPIALAIVPVPAADQSEPIAITGAVIHVGNGMVINEGIITFNGGLITAVGTATEGVDLVDHLLIDVQGRHVYPGFVLPNSTLGLIEVNSVRATSDVLEEGDINASVRSAIAYNTDSEIIPANRFNGILTAQVVPQGGLISGSSTIFKLDGWNWEDAMLAEDVGLHMHWPSYTQRRRNPETGLFETVDNENYEGQTQLLHSLFQDAQAYTGQPLNLNLLAMQPLFNGVAKLFVHADEARQIISAVRFARSYGVQDITLVGGADALSVKDFLLAQDIPVIYERIHELPLREWQDVDTPFKTPFLLHNAGIKIGIGGGATSIDRQRNLPFFAGTAAAYGLEREIALTMITSVNAEILGVAERVGTMELGKDATLFIANGDILDIRTTVQTAFIQGRQIDLNDRHKMLDSKYRIKYQQKGILK